MSQKKKFADLSMAAKGAIVAGSLFVFVSIIGVSIALKNKNNNEPSLPQEVVGAAMSPVAQNIKPGFGTTGTGESPVPGYHEMIMDYERRMALEAAASGKSSISGVVIPTEPEKQQAPAPAQQVVQTPVTVIAPPPVSNQDTERLAQAALRQLNESLARWGSTQPVLMGASWPTPIKEAPPAPSSDNDSGKDLPPDPTKAIARAGSIHPITFDTAGNTSSPGVIRATIHGGPLNGAVLIGQISRFGEYGATVRFARLVTEKETIAVNAVAMNSSATGTDVADRVDKKFLERYIFKPLGAAASALAEAIPMKQESSVVNSVTGSSTASSGISSKDVLGIAASRAIETASADLAAGSDQPVAYIDPSWMSNVMASVMFIDDVFPGRMSLR